MKYAACLLAAGKGSRTNLKYNKVFYPLTPDKNVLQTILDLFLADEDCAQVLVVSAPCEMDYVKEMLRDVDERIEVVSGGASRQESVYNALQKVQPDLVFIHDGARPYLKRQQIEDLKQALQHEKAALLMVPATDTIKEVDESGHVVRTLPRAVLWHAQTPQCFDTRLILSCHEAALRHNIEATDDAQLVEMFSDVPVFAVPSDPANKKITVPGDLEKP